MTWTKDFPQEPKTYWWLRVHYKDGSTTKSTVVFVEENKNTVTYHMIGDLHAYTIAELKNEAGQIGAVVDFAGPITPPEDDKK